MNKCELDIIKKIAEIEGLDFSQQGNDIFVKSNGWPEIYNPFSWEILGPLMVKYKVEIQYAERTALIVDSHGNDAFWSFFEDESKIPQAILECIIESEE